jgi:uncharacterized protein YjbI with pentapeptide repeats
MDTFYTKYIKYKSKYFELKGQTGGDGKPCDDAKKIPNITIVQILREYDCNYNQLNTNTNLKQLLVDFNYDIFVRINIEQPDLITVANLKSKGFPLLFLKDKGFPLVELKKAGFTLEELKEAEFNVYRLKEAEFLLEQLKQVGFSARELKSAGFTLKELKEAGVSASELKSAGFSAIDLKKAGFTAMNLKKAGFTLSNFKEAGFTSSELNSAGFSAVDLTEAGVTLEGSLKLKYEADLDNIKRLKKEGLTVIQIKEKGYSLNKIKNAGLFSYKDLKEAGIKFIDLLTDNEKKIRNSILDEKLRRLKEAEFPITEFIGISIDKLRKAGYTEEQLKKLS